MEVSKIKTSSGEINVIFTGKNYFFMNSFFGLIGIAERSKDNSKHFILRLDNYRTIGGSMYTKIETVAKKFINKSESKYIQCKCTYEVIREDTNNMYYISVECRTR